MDRNLNLSALGKDVAMQFVELKRLNPIICFSHCCWWDETSPKKPHKKLSALQGSVGSASPDFGERGLHDDDSEAVKKLTLILEQSGKKGKSTKNKLLSNCSFKEMGSMFL